MWPFFWGRWVVLAPVTLNPQEVFAVNFKTGGVVHTDDLRVKFDRFLPIMPLLQNVVLVAPPGFVHCTNVKVQDCECFQTTGQIQEATVCFPKHFRVVTFYNKALYERNLIFIINEHRELAVHSIGTEVNQRELWGCASLEAFRVQRARMYLCFGARKHYLGIGRV